MSSKELLREAYVIIDGIPDTRLDLSHTQWSKEKDPFKDPDSRCCPMAWLLHHPNFVTDTLSGREVTVVKTRTEGQMWRVEMAFEGQLFDYAAFASLLFGLPLNVAEDMFGPIWQRGDSTLNHKSAWQQRVKRHLAGKPIFAPK